MDYLKKYFELKTQIKQLNEELKAVEPKVFDRVAEEEDYRLQTDYCRYQVVYRPKWKYSDELTQTMKLQREKISTLKKLEELNGKAEKISDGGQLRMTDRK